MTLNHVSWININSEVPKFEAHSLVSKILYQKYLNKLL